ncbi:MAG: CapA family protein [Armatimonadota bacterium]
MKKIVDRARSQADMVVVALHWGVERQPFPAAYQVSLGRLFVDAGADVVIGAHPHVLQPAELYKDKPIIYSLGNFVNPGGGSSAMYKLTFEKTSFRSAMIIPTTYSGGRAKYAHNDGLAISQHEQILNRMYPVDGTEPLTYHPIISDQ